MFQHLMRNAAIVSAFVLFGVWGCGQSGSDPVVYPEVRFEVRPAGQSTFRVDSLIGGGVSHASVTGQDFIAVGPFDFVLENAAPPYQGIFTLVSGDQITVTVTVMSITGQTQVSDATAPGKPTAMVLTGGPAPSMTPGPGNPEVRFDVCAPLRDGTSCSTMDSTVGSFGVLFTGTLGDPFISHLLSGTTPTIYFLEGPRDTVNGVFTRQPPVGALLLAQLFINGTLKQSGASVNDVVLKQDL